MDNKVGHKPLSSQGPQALRRGLTVLSTLKEISPQGMTATQLAKTTGIERSTIHRLLLSLEATGWVQKGEAGRRYFSDIQGQVSLAISSIQNEVTRMAVIRAIASMRRLADRLGDAVFLVVRDGPESVSVHREIGGYPVQILASYPGKRFPLGIGSSGLALLAALPEEEAHHVVELNAHRLEEYGGMNPKILHRLRKNTQIRGYSVMQNYAVRGAMGVGCALTDTKGSPVLAMSVSAISERMPLARQSEIAHMLQQELEGLRLDGG